MEKRPRRVVSTWLDDYYIQKIKELVESGEYNSPSEILREALRQWFKQRERRRIQVVQRGRIQDNND